MKIHVVTLFPEFFDSPLRAGIPGRAVQAGRVEFGFVNPRDFTSDRHRTVDDTPYGGGPGMVLKPEPMVQAIESVTGPRNPRQMPVILLSPQGPALSQRKAQRLAALSEVVIVCGRYKAIDERVRQLVVTEELSVGDFVLSGGEPACLVLVDAMVRLLPGALGDQDSAESDSFGSHWQGGLDCAYYTRPESFRGRRVPEVLLSGHHERIASWRRLQALERTRTRRPDLMHPAGES
jgi:tRNA (guanine37-N1)-methyltransferase